MTYLHKEAEPTPAFSRNLWSDLEDIEGVIGEFEENGRLLAKRRNGNCLYHEIIALPKDLPVPLERQAEILLELAGRYLEERTPASLVYGKIHQDVSHSHIHLMVSANDAGGRRRNWCTKARFGRIHRELEAYCYERFPEIERPKSLRKSRGHEKKRSHPEQGIGRRGQVSEKMRVGEAVASALGVSVSEAELKERLEGVGLVLYQRGKTLGVRDPMSGRRYRMGTLGLNEQLEASRAQWREFARRGRAIKHARSRDLKGRIRDQVLAVATARSLGRDSR